jgi:Ca-activated chloride channel homolog
LFSALSTIVGAPLTIDPLTLGGETAAVPYLGSAVIVLFSDGENTAPPAPIDVAKLASVAGVKIYPVGIGLDATAVLDIDGFKVATTVDEGTLVEIARVTNGTYFRAADEAGLASVYSSINLHWRPETRLREITGLMTGLSVVLLGLASALSLGWFGRIV